MWTDLACAALQAYVDMRKIGSGRGMVSAYPRQLESLIRLAEAHAKVRFSEKVETIDVEEAKRLHREALKQSATDPRTGFVDISILTTGKQHKKKSNCLNFWGVIAARHSNAFRVCFQV